MNRRSPLALAITAAMVLTGTSATIAQEVGTDVPLVDAEGVEHGTITVREVVDPFTENDPAAPPAEGSRYVGLTVTYQAALDQSLDAQPYQVQLQDANGVLYPSGYVPRPPDVLVPDLQSQLMAPDNRISGFIGFVVPADATIDKVVLSPGWDRILDIADLTPGDTPALGDAVTYTDAAGASTTITTALIDPFTAFDPASPPAADSRFVVVQPVFENNGQVPYYADPYDMYLRDASGLLIAPTTVYQPPEMTVANLEAQTINPGDRISGYVGFQLPADATVADILYYPESGRVALIAHLGGAAQPGAEDASPSGAPAAPEASPAG